MKCLAILLLVICVSFARADECDDACSHVENPEYRQDCEHCCKALEVELDEDEFEELLESVKECHDDFEEDGNEEEFAECLGECLPEDLPEECKCDGGEGDDGNQHLGNARK